MPDPTELTPQEGDGTADVESAGQTVDRGDLEKRTAERLNALLDDEPGDAVDETPETSEEPEIPEAEEPADEPEETDEPGDEGTAETGKKPISPTLPDAHRRSLKAYGWEDTDIDENLTALGAKFLETAARIHKNRNAEIADWAAAGRAARQASAPSGQQTAPQPQQGETLALKPVDAKALKEHYGDDTLIDAIVAPVNAAIEQINALMPVIQTSQQRSQQAEIEALSRQIEGFFGSDGIKAYRELYGTADRPLTAEQVEKRNAVLETADALMAGAAIQGRRLSFDDAMTLAHDSLSSGYKTQAVRREMQTKMQTRQKGITLKPSGKKTASKTTKSGDRTAIEKNVAAGLAKVFA